MINIEDKYSVGVEPTKNVKKEIDRWHCGSASVLALQQCIGVGTASQEERGTDGNNVSSEPD